MGGTSDFRCLKDQFWSPPPQQLQGVLSVQHQHRHLQLSAHARRRLPPWFQCSPGVRAVLKRMPWAKHWFHAETSAQQQRQLPQQQTQLLQQTQQPQQQRNSSRSHVGRQWPYLGYQPYSHR